MGIKNLPGGGIGFRVSTGAGNFTRRLNVAVMHDAELKNLANNTGSILKVVKKYEGAIRVHKFDRLRQLSAYRQIKKLEGANLSYADKKDVKNLLKHFSEAADSGNKPKRAPIIVKAEDPNGLTKGDILRLTSVNKDHDGNRINSHNLSVAKKDNQINPRDLGINNQSNYPSLGSHAAPNPYNPQSTTLPDLSSYVGNDRAKRGQATLARLIANEPNKGLKTNNSLGSPKPVKKFSNINNLLAS